MVKLVIVACGLFAAGFRQELMAVTRPQIRQVPLDFKFSLVQVYFQNYEIRLVASSGLKEEIRKVSRTVLSLGHHHFARGKRCEKLHQARSDEKRSKKSTRSISQEY